MHSYNDCGGGTCRTAACLHIPNNGWARADTPMNWEHALHTEIYKYLRRLAIKAVKCLAFRNSIKLENIMHMSTTIFCCISMNCINLMSRVVNLWYCDTNIVEWFQARTYWVFPVDYSSSGSVYFDNFTITSNHWSEQQRIPFEM